MTDAKTETPSPTGFVRFQKAMADFSSSYITPAYEASKKGSKLVRPTDSAFERVFRGYFEISEALDSLQFVETLIVHTAPRSQHIDKQQYLKFIISSHLQEIYILHQRMKMYGEHIAKIYGQKELPRLVETLVYKPLEKILKIRGAHVHQQRYSDDELDRLNMFATFLRADHPLGEDFAFEYSLQKKEWTKKIAANNKAITGLIDKFFDYVWEFMLVDGKIYLPNNAYKKADNSASRPSHRK